MKKSICLFVFSLAISFAAFSQTTSADYTYITTTFKVQLENGLGDKPGYHTKKIRTVTIGERSVTLYRVFNEDDYYDGRVTAYAAIYKKGSGAKQFMCIPHPDSDQMMHDKFWTAIMYPGAYAQCESKLKLMLKAVSYCRWE